MKTIVIALHELYGLFVEDVSYTVAIAAWLLAAVFGLPHFVPPYLLAPVLFVGLGVILLENIARSARSAS